MRSEPGHLPNASLTAFACLYIGAVAIRLALWQRVLLGLRKNHLMILLQRLTTALSLVLVWLILRARNEFQTLLSLASVLGSFAVATIGRLQYALDHWPC